MLHKAFFVGLLVAHATHAATTVDTPSVPYSPGAGVSAWSRKQVNPSATRSAQEGLAKEGSEPKKPKSVIGKQRAEAEVKKETIDKPKTDYKDYEFFNVKKGVRAVLISNPRADYSSFTVNIASGYLDDPSERRGLALLTALTIDSGRDSQGRSLEDSIRAFQGETDYSVYGDLTQLIVKVPASNLDEALAAFSDCIHKPPVTAGSLAGVIEKAETLVEGAKKDDSAIINDAATIFFEPRHSLAQSPYPTSKVLKAVAPEDVLFYHEEHYLKGRVSIVLYGKESLGELRHKVEKHFSFFEPLDAAKIPDPVSDTPLHPGEMSYFRTHMIDNILFVAFPINRVYNYWRSKPYLLLKRYFEEDTERTLQSDLRAAKYLVDLTVVVKDDICRDRGMFVLQANLTDKGVKEINGVLQTVFQHVAHVRKHGMSNDYVSKVLEPMDISFNYNPSPPSHMQLTREVGRTLSYAHSDEQIRSVLKGSIVEKHSDSELGTFLTTTLDPDNVIVGLGQRDVCPALKALIRCKETGGLNVSYKFKPLPVKPDVKIIKLTFALDTTENKYKVGAEETRLVNCKAESEPVVNPEEIKKDHPIIYHHHDCYFKHPGLRASINLYSGQWAQKMGTVVHEASLLIIKGLLDRSISQEASEMASYLGELEFKLENNAISMHASGFPKQIDGILKVGVEALKELKMDDFDSVKEGLVKDYQGTLKISATTQSFVTALEKIQEGYQTPARILAALKTATKDGIREAFNGFWNKYAVEALVLGNVTKDDAIQLVQKVSDSLKQDHPNQDKVERKCPAIKTDFPATVDVSTTDWLNVGFIGYRICKADKHQDKAQAYLLGQLLNSAVHSQFPQSVSVQAFRSQAGSDIFIFFYGSGIFTGPRKIVSRFEHILSGLKLPEGAKGKSELQPLIDSAVTFLGERFETPDARWREVNGRFETCLKDFTNTAMQVEYLKKGPVSYDLSTLLQALQKAGDGPQGEIRRIVVRASSPIGKLQS